MVSDAVINKLWKFIANRVVGELQDVHRNPLCRRLADFPNKKY